ncbi:sensor histidine kinase [Colwellia psychrerythraea]|uniref:histidine kinase n=1 Tax=Colwellia psychrerythraea TaxID=28229 RepID=A0A099KAM5_COLPS|nr:HAMP domain-containing sensor histidine kinase [Colwellia psychrerythraea]KGJ86623.1 integral membrane sensor signal transduction histidine kinase [Colwellia psychrerythraea]
MKKLYPAKYITALYFSLIAIALVTIHFSVYEFTTSDLEHLYTTNRLEKIESYTSDYLSDKSIQGVTSLDLQPQGSSILHEHIVLYFASEMLPLGFPKFEEIPFNEVIEIRSASDHQAYFVSKSKLDTLDGKVDVYFLVGNSLFELSETQLFSLHTKQIIISISLLILTLFAVFKISTKLTNPISHLVKTLSLSSPDDLSPISITEEVSTIELAKLINTFNEYQERIKASMERERSFNRYASHELRSPLMVMTGAINILEASSDIKVVSRQRERLKKATKEMTEFVETLLSLSKSTIESAVRLIDKDEITNIILSHEHLISNKKISWKVNFQGTITILMPEFSFHILLGNIIKNAFAYTQYGEIVINVMPTYIEVIDTGKGIDGESIRESVDGYGLGLLLVKDICHRYGWTFTLNNNLKNGCTAKVEFS